MKNLKLPIGIIVTALAVAVSAQSPRPVRKTSAVSASPAASTSSAAFATAATTNATLRNDLTWTFGGKQQRGWYLYELLIGETLNSEHDPTTSDFAASLAKWQKKRGIAADGVLDQDALMAMVSQWQSNRLKNRTYATPDQLLTAPPSDFYDPSRAEAALHPAAEIRVLLRRGEPREPLRLQVEEVRSVLDHPQHAHRLLRFDDGVRLVPVAIARPGWRHWLGLRRAVREQLDQMRPTTVVNQARRLSTWLVSVRLRRIQAS